MAKTVFAFLALVAIQSAYSAQISFKWCVLPAEKIKCNVFIKYVNETARNKSLDVAVGCVEGSSTDDCIVKIKNKQADLRTLDGGHVLEAGKTNDFVPIVSENYGKYGVKYYAVAVVKKAKTPDLNITSLKGKKSCHTGARRTAGWNVPIGYLRRSKRLPAVKCKDTNNDINDFLSAANFFSQSCVPGVKTYNKSGNIPGKLCALCAGTGSDKCSTDSKKNMYVGYHGAFKCMADDKGGVAFVKHTTTEEVVNGGNRGNVTDYAYLCKDGTTKAIGQHQKCNLGINPAHAVVTRKDNTDIPDIVAILTAMSDMYGTNSSKFQLFNSSNYGGTNLMFKDSSTALVAIAKEKQTYQGFLGDDYVKDNNALKSCDVVTTVGPKSESTMTTPYMMLLLVIALLALISL